MRLTYVYPEGAANGDDFVVDEVNFSPSGIEITLKKYWPKADDRDSAALAQEALRIADRIVKELKANAAQPSPALYLLIQAYRATRPKFQR